MNSTQTMGQTPDAPENPTKSWQPTKKWLAATVTAIGGIVTLVLTKHGQFDTDVWLAVSAAFFQAVVSYITPNLDTPGGIPLRTSGS